MPRLAELTGINIPQHEFEGVPDLTVPADFSKRFRKVAKAAGDEVPLRFIAGVVLSDEYEDLSKDDVIETAEQLAGVDEYLRTNPGTPILFSNICSLDVGRAAENSGIYLRDSRFESRFFSPRVMIPASETFAANLGATGASYFNHSELGADSVKYEGDSLDLHVPSVMLTPDHRNATIEEAVAKVTESGSGPIGVLAVGEKPVSDLLLVIAEKELGVETRNRGTAEYEYSLALLGSAALRGQGAELQAGTKGDLIHSTVREILARLVAKGLGSRYEQSQLGSMSRLSRRLSAAELTAADFPLISAQAIGFMQEGTAYEGLDAIATRNGGSLEATVRDNTRSLLRNLMGIKLPE